jgi:hypothetical protein
MLVVCLATAVSTALEPHKSNNMGGNADTIGPKGTGSKHSTDIPPLHVPRFARGAACVVVQALIGQRAHEVLVAAGCSRPHTNSTHAGVIKCAAVEIVACCSASCTEMMRQLRMRNVCNRVQIVGLR